MSAAEAVLLVMAKAPVAGRAKTRLAAHVGDRAAAELAAAALLDTLDACEDAFGPARCHLALAGDLDDAVEVPGLRARLRRWQVRPQRGAHFGQRLAHAHADVHAAAGGPVVQVGMDTPHLQPQQLQLAARLLEAEDAVLGPAEDGGWWLLGCRRGELAAGLSQVPMSQSDTGEHTRAALRAAGASIAELATLRDVDTAEDAHHVASRHPGLRFSVAWGAGGPR